MSTADIPPTAPAPYLRRFSATERVAHWLLAVTFASMLGSGVLMGGIGPLRHRAMLIGHVGSAVVLVCGLAAMTDGRRQRRQLAVTAAELGHLTPGDLRWLHAVPTRLLSGRRLPPAGRFNAGQKLNSRILAGLLLALYLTGLGELGRHVGALEAIRPLGTLHGAGAAAIGAVVAGHIYLATLNPSTRHSLRGMTLGSVRREWALEHHADWVVAVERSADDE